MNRGFRAPEPPAPRGRTLGAVINDKDDDLALFLEMRSRDNDRNALLLHNSDELEAPLGNTASEAAAAKTLFLLRRTGWRVTLLECLTGSKAGSSPIFKIVSPAPPRKTGIDDFLNSDSDKNDYDWLLTPPGTPLFPSMEKESQRSPVGQVETPKTRPTLLKSRLATLQDPSSRNVVASRQPTPASSLSSSSVVSRRPSSCGGRSTTASRPATPTGRPTLATSSKPARSSTPTPTSRTTLPSKSVAPPPRSATPTPSRTPLPSKSVAPPPRSSTPVRSSTPTSRPSVPSVSKPALRSSSPTRRPSTPSTTATNSAPPGRSPISKTGPTTSKAILPSRGTSPTVKSRPWKPSDMPGFSLDAPPNLRTSLPDRPSSASRGRPGAPTSRSSSVEPGPSVRPRRQSCSPSRGRTPNGSAVSGSSVPAVSRSHVNGGDKVSPVVIGSKMVERVVNSRRLAPPKRDNPESNNSAMKSALSPDSSGFGRTLSKKSLDMALRHMDIRRSIPNSLRPLMTKIPASSVYSIRSGASRSRTLSVSDSPLGTSSNASSEPSVNNNNIHCLDGSEFGDDDVGSEKGVRSSLAGSLAR